MFYCSLTRLQKALQEQLTKIAPDTSLRRQLEIYKRNGLVRGLMEDNHSD
jgi:hypothetical protein